jgi:hypothetical protein
LDEGLKTGTVDVLEMSTTDSGGNAPSPTEIDLTDDLFGDGRVQNHGGPKPPEPSDDDDAEMDLFGDRRQPMTSGPRPPEPMDEEIVEVQLTDEIPSRHNDVNHLLIINKSDRPLYVMPGEIIIGGDQDRAVAQEIVIQPGAKPTSVEVFCVEHGRWSDRDESRTVAELAAAGNSASLLDSVAVLRGISIGETAKATKQGKFVASLGCVNRPVRQTVQQSADQGAVWDKVAQENGKSGVRSASDAFTSNYGDPASVKRLEPYLAKLKSPVADTSQVVGVIVAVNGKVQSVDVFESTPLFKKLWPKLLKSYALDAANDKPDGTSKTAATRAHAQTFLEQTVAAQVQQADDKHGVAVVKRESKDVVCFSASTPEAKIGRGNGPMHGEAIGNLEAHGGSVGTYGGSVGDSVHAAGYAK